MAGSRAVYGLIASLCALMIGILQLALERSVLSHFRHRLAKHSTAWPPHQQHPSEIMPLAMAPEHLITASTNLIVACGAMGLVTGVVGVFRRASFSDAPANNRMRPNNYSDQLQANPRGPYLSLVVTLLATLLALASLIHTSLTESTRSIFQYTDYTSSHQSFTRESWTCQLATYYPDDAWSDLAGTCWDARTARWLLAPLLAAQWFQFWHIFVDIAASRTKQHHHRRSMELGSSNSSAKTDDTLVGEDD